MCIRDSGYTKASGTGSCAAAVTAYRLGMVVERGDPAGIHSLNHEYEGTGFET